MVDLAEQLSYRYQHWYPELKDDILQEARMASIDGLKDSRYQEFGDRWLNAFIRGRIRTYVRKHWITPKNRQTVDLDSHVYTEEGNCVTLYDVISFEVWKREMHESLDYESLLTAIGLTKRERIILEFRLDGLTYREISALVGLSPQAVLNISNQIQERIYEKKDLLKEYLL